MKILKDLNTIKKMFLKLFKSSRMNFKNWEFNVIKMLNNSSHRLILRIIREKIIF